MIYKSSKQTINRYRAAEGINQSYLKHIGNVYYFNSLFHKQTQGDLYFEEKEYFTLGNAVDKLITDRENFKKDFYVSTLGSKPSDKIMSVVQQVFDTYNFEGCDGVTLFQLSDFIIRAAREQGYQPKYKDPTIIKKIVNEGGDYFDELIASEGKTILSLTEKMLIDTIYSNIINNPNFGHLFLNHKDTDIYYQMPIMFTHNEVKCKGLMDMVKIYHKEQIIMPIDIKTMGDYTLNFESKFYKNRYDFQGAFYTEGLSKPETLERLSEVLKRDVTKYSISDFHFIVESTIAPGSPVIFKMGNEAYRSGKHGVKKDYMKRIGFEEALNDYKWYTENSFDKQRILVEQKDSIELN